MSLESTPKSSHNSAFAIKPVPNRLLLVVIVLGVLASTPFLMGTQAGQRGLLAVSLFGFLALLIAYSPRVGISAFLVYMTILGGARRWLIPIMGMPATDPLLLVMPLIVGLYFAGLLVRRKIPRDTRIARLLVTLIIVMLLQILNPAQGGLAVGLAGTLFMLVPVLWYYVGREAGSSEIIQRVAMTVAVMALVGALYGLKQTYFGFADSEMMWFATAKSGYAALNLNALRAFSFFASPTEYVTYLSIGMVLFFIIGLRGQRLAFLPIPLLFWAVFVTGIRSPIVATLVTCAILWAIQRKNIRSWVPRMMLALVVAAIGMVWSLRQVNDDALPENVRAEVNHQSEGFLSPQNSTAGGHVAMVFWGISGGIFTHPLGLGLGSATMAAARLGGTAVNSEADLSNIFLSTGFVGGILYLCIMGTVISRMFRYWQRVQTTTALLITGILCVLLGHWVQGELYSVSPLPFFLIGALDRLCRDVPKEEVPVAAEDAE